MKKIIMILVAVLMSLSVMTACQSNDSVPKLKYSTQYPTTAQEYNQLINQKIVPFLNVCEGHASKGRDIIAGKYPVKEELTSVEDTLKYINEIYDSCKVIYPPDTEKQRHSDTLMQMQRVINAVEVYQEKLKDYEVDRDGDKFGKTIDILVSEFTSLKNMFNLVA
ncbi:MAG: hypothetical protein ILA17_07815 [Ruminococcus sp.]|nr:hypothetical protein [Ruminococcus sp.]MBP1537761.1 hypothetical protein [Ruminococcus sp.]